MPDFAIREFATLSPTQCILCGTSEPPFLDTVVDVIGYGRIYLCVGTDQKPGCLHQAARAAGCADPALRRVLETKVDDLEATVQMMRDQNDRLSDALGNLRSELNEVMA